ncbi:MAG: putative colanic acid biosynthesis glycosyltransferase [Halocynthiibacter sp.]|jgi:putative colanic acid biosynthesis glycosyltransferase
MFSPEISIVTVAFRNLGGIKDTEASINWAQTDGFEWIVIDGGSDDGTQAYLTELTRPNMQAICEPDEGIFDAMNKGITAAKGKYILFMNAGDRFFDHTTLPQLISFATAHNQTLIYGDSFETSSDGLCFKKPARRPFWNVYSMFTHHQSILYRRVDILDGYDRSYQFSGDWALTSRLLSQSGASASYFGKPICKFERGGVSQRDDHRKTINREHWRILRKESRLFWPTAALLFGVKRSANTMRRLLPSLYDLLRFGGPRIRP